MRSKALAALAVTSALVLAACSSGSTTGSSSGTSDSGRVTLTVGASPSPHARILQYIDDNLAQDAGIDLNIVEYSDYVQPNVALNEGELDANFFQTVPYLESQQEEFGYDFTAGAGVHLEPLGVYSEKITNLDNLADGATVGIISEVSNQARALALLAEQGLVSLPESGDVNVYTVTKLKNFEFKEVEGAQLVRSLADVDIAVVNGNYALEGGLTPSEDALALESTTDNPYANVLVWRANTEKSDAIAILENLLHSDDVRSYIEETWSDASVIPAF